MLKRNRNFLIIGVLLSLISKWLQLQSHSFWGDVLVILAAIFFVLALLLSIPRYTAYMENKKQRRSAIRLAVECCLTVVSFQFFWTGLYVGHFIFTISLFLCRIKLIALAIAIKRWLIGSNICVTAYPKISWNKYHPASLWYCVFPMRGLQLAQKRARLPSWN